jgi:very-short-patch-repair endonuclease
MPKPRPLPLDLPSAFTYAEGLDRGVSARRLRNADLASPFRGARSRATDDDVPSLALAYSPLLLPDQRFSSLTAAELHGLRMPEGFVARSIHVTSVAPTRAPRRVGVVGHQSKSNVFVLVNGLAVSDPVDAWWESAQCLPIDDLIVMGDTLIRRRAPLVALEQLKIEVPKRQGERGTSRIARALPQMRESTDSARETMLRLLLERAGFPEPEVNGEIRNRFGALIAHGDLVYRRHRTIVEYEGDHHRTDERQFNIDLERLDELAEEKWRIIRVTKKLMWQRVTLFGKVTTALEEGGWQPRGR